MTAILESENYNVVVADNSRHALELSIALNPDLIITDTVILEMCGLEFCREFKRNARVSHFPILLISSISSENNAQFNETLSLADDYLFFPFRRQEFLSRVSKLIKRNRAERHYRDLVESSPDMILTMDLQGNITSVNLATERFFGRSTAELVNTNLKALIGEEQPEISFEHIEKLEPDQPTRIFYQISNAQGSVRELEALLSLITDTKGIPVGVRSVVRDITERKTANDDPLPEPEIKYRELVENLDDLLYITDENGLFTYLSPAALNLTGYDSSKLLGSSYFDLVHAEDVARVKEHFNQIKAADSSAIEFRWLTMSGDVRWVKSSDKAVMREGVFTGVRGLVTDVTEQKQIEDSIQRSKKRYSELFENANDVIYVHDLNGNFTSLNKAGERITGYSHEEILKMNFADIVAPNKIGIAKEIIAQVDNAATTYEITILTKSGEFAELEISTRLVYEDGEPVGVQGIGRDVTRRKRMEAALRASEERFFKAFDASPDALSISNFEDGIFLYVNNSFLDVTGYTREQVIGSTALELRLWFDPQVRANLIKKLVEHTRVLREEFQYRVKTGEIRTGLFSAEIIEIGGGVCMLTHMTDITDRKKAELALKESEQRYRELVEHSGVFIFTHDLQGVVLSANVAVTEALGYSAEEIVGSSIIEILAPAARDIGLDYLQKIAVEKSASGRVPVCTKTGEEMVWEYRNILNQSGEGNYYVIGYAQDITERKRAEDALQYEREFLKAILNNIEEGVIACDAKGVITLANRATQETYGFSDLPVPADYWAEEYRFYHPNGKTLMTKEEVPLYRALKGERVHNEETVITSRNSLNSNTVLANGQAIFNAGGEKIGAVVAMHNITERVKSEQRLLASVQQLETLTALTTAVSNWDEVNKLLEGLADSITNFTDYGTCFVRVFSDNGSQESRFTSFSSNIPPDVAEQIRTAERPREELYRLINEGVRIEVGELGFASYYPITHHHLLQRFDGNRFKSNVEFPFVELGDRWHAEDELFVPLITHSGEYIGYISLDDPRSGRAPDKQSLLSVVALARQVVQLIRQQMASEALAQQLEREAIVNRISNAIRQSFDVNEVFRTAVNELSAYLNVDRCTLYLRDSEAGVIRSAAEYHAPDVVPAKSEIPMESVTDLAQEIQKLGVLAIDDITNDARITQSHREMLSAVGTRSIMWVGTRTGDDVPATFAITTTSKIRHWSKTDIELAQAVANQTGIAILQAALYQQAEATSAREALINRLSLTIRASLRLPEILSAATRELGRALSASRVYLRLYKPSLGTSPIAHEYIAPYAYSLRRVKLGQDDPIGQFLLRQTQTLVIHDARNFVEGSSEVNKFITTWAQDTETFSSINCPLVVSGRFRGTLCIDQTDRLRHWQEDEVALIEAVATQLATGIAQAELFEMTKRAKKEWETTFNAMSDGIFIFDNKGLLIRVNRAGAAMEDSWPHLLLGRRCCDILRAGPEENTCIVERAVSEGRTVTVEITPGGLSRSLVISAEPLVDSETGTTGVVCTARDLSELRKAEAEARERQSLLTNILTSVREPICAIDTQGRFLWSNNATTITIGYKPEELIGQHFLDLIYPLDHIIAKEAFADALKGSASSYETRYQTRNGEVRYAMIDNAPLVQDDRTTGVLWIARDITEQKEQHQRAAQADKLRALGQLASGVAHDFNNALAAILGRTQLLTRQTKDPSLTRSLGIIQTAAEDAAATVRRIQTFARQTSDKRFERLEVVSLLRDSIEITRTRWENEALMQGVHIDVHLSTKGEYYTVGSASELREVFVNLIVNAVDAMPKGGHLFISCHLQDDKLIMRFMDTGTGMSDEVRERIFEPFYTTKGLQGTGLGLAVSYSIIQGHDGSLTVSSEPGKGTTFEVELPHIKHKQDFVAEIPTLIETPSLEVLVIDDEDFVRETLADMLEALGHKVVAVDGGPTAFTQMEGRHFDLVFTDLSMPEVDGWEVAQVIRDRWTDTNIIMVTGYGTGIQSPDGEDNLVDGVIGKPFDFDQVSETIAHVTMNSKRELVQ